MPLSRPGCRLCWLRPMKSSRMLMSSDATIIRPASRSQIIYVGWDIHASHSPGGHSIRLIQSTVYEGCATDLPGLKYYWIPKMFPFAAATKLSRESCSHTSFSRNLFQQLRSFWATMLWHSDLCASRNNVVSRSPTNCRLLVLITYRRGLFGG